LVREKAIDGFAMYTQHTTDTHRVETAVVDEPPNRLRVHAELRSDVSDADESARFSTHGRHARVEAYSSRRVSVISARMALDDLSSVAHPIGLEQRTERQ
jgi:pyridoxine/pyridoxamine 5'-phosphate oxidase